MDMTGERRIPAPRQTVWDALNDPEVLKASIPGCTSLDKLSDTELKATAAIKIGPISAKFGGAVTLSDIDPPNGYTISGEGQGGVAGFAKGGAKVTLTADGNDTILSFTVNAQVGGKMAQLGARLIDATARQMADAFFDRFSRQVEALVPAAPPPADHPASDHATPDHGPADHPAAGSAPGPRGLVVMAENLAPPPPPPRSSIPIGALIPREPFGLPLAFWLGAGAYAVIVLLALGSLLK
jgi:carbon monoxide dehydrogenase subunit G